MLAQTAHNNRLSPVNINTMVYYDDTTRESRRHRLTPFICGFILANPVTAKIGKVHIKSVHFSNS